MKKGSFYSILIVIVLTTISFTGCFSDDDEKAKINPLNIHISNGTNITYNVTISLINPNNIDILNQTIELKSLEQHDFKDITDNEDQYTLIVELDDNRMQKDENIYVNENRLQVSIHIDHDNISINQKVE